MRTINTALILCCVAASASAMEATAGNQSFQLQAVKRQVSEQVIGLTAIIEALATKLKAAEDEITTLKAFKERSDACASNGKLYDSNTDACVDPDTEAAPAPAPVTYANCGSHGHNTSWSVASGGYRSTYYCNDGVVTLTGQMYTGENMGGTGGGN